MDVFDFRNLTNLLFTAIFAAFGIYHLLSYLVLKHKILLHYFILILGITLHWSLYFFMNNSFGSETAQVADKISLTTAMITTFGLLQFTRNYLAIKKDNHPRLSKTYKLLIGTVVCLPFLHITNTLTIGLVWLNEILVLLAAITALAAILINIYSGIRLFNAHKLNRYYLYSYAPILLSAIIYIGAWFAKQYSDFDATPIIIATSVLTTIQLILFSLLISFKFKEIEDDNMKIQLEANTKLRNEVERQTKKLMVAKAELENQNAELEEVSKLKNKLFSLLAHDVRAPLNNFVVILGLIEAELSDVELKHLTEKLKGEISDRILMVNDLLQWSHKQLDGIKLDKTICDLENVFRSVKQEFSRVADKKNIEIELSVCCQEIFIDETMLKVILRNMVSNAIKFSENGQKIIMWSACNSENMEIGVQDFGIGMDINWYQNIKSGDRPRTRKGTEGEKGTGFGLLISKDFAEMNGGELICESEVDKGTNFVLRFTYDSKDPILNQALSHVALPFLRHR